ncbi:MAG: extracellular solute-binding protein [Anaerolineae bacterium]|nr:extracellular solute-binding protein [Anaerolineae bacterium]
MASRRGVSRRRFIRAGMGLAVGTGLAACAAAQTPQLVEREATRIIEASPQPQAITEQVEIRVGMSSSTTNLPIYTRILFPRFADAHPEIKVSFETAPWGEFYTKAEAQIAAQDLPDVFAISTDNVATYAARKIPLNLMPLLEADQELRDAVSESAWSLLQYGENTQWGATQRVGGCALAYNEVLFDEAGLDYPNENWTNEDFLVAAKLLTIDESGRNSTDPSFDASSVKQWGYWARNYGTTDYGPQAYGFGGSFFADPLNMEPTFTDPKTIAGIQWTMDLVFEHHVSPLAADVEGFGQTRHIAFLGGHCAMMTHVQGQEGSWPQGDWQQWKDGFGLQATFMPRWPEKRATCVWGEGCLIPNYSKHINEAWAFIRFSIMDIPFQTGQTDPGKNQMPVNVEAYNDPRILNSPTPPLTYQGSFIEPFLPDRECFAWDFDPNPVWGAWWKAMTDNMTLVWEQRISVEEAMQNTQDEAVKAISEWKAGEQAG